MRAAAFATPSFSVSETAGCGIGYLPEHATSSHPRHARAEREGYLQRKERRAMSRSSWLSRTIAAARKLFARRKHRRPRLFLEPLEDRCVPATFTPSYFKDSFHVMGRYSLRDAIADSNMDQGNSPDTIQLLAGTYVLSFPNPTDPNTHRSLQENGGLYGDLDIFNGKHSLTIRGKVVGGMIATTITAADLEDRVFQIINKSKIAKSGTEVVFRDLIIQGGLARDDGTDNAAAGTTAALGGAILSKDGAKITLRNVIVQNSRAVGADGAAGSDFLVGGDGFGARGGAIYVGGGALKMTGGQINNARASGGAGGTGGNNTGSQGNAASGGTGGQAQ